mgnify:CR=1 FL=1
MDNQQAKAHECKPCRAIKKYAMIWLNCFSGNERKKEKVRENESKR